MLVALRDPHEELRAAAGQALGKIGPAALPELIKTLDATDPVIVHALAGAIGRIGAPVDAKAVPGLVVALKHEVAQTREACAQRAAGHPDRAAEMRAAKLNACVRGSMVISALALAGQPGVKAASDFAKGGDEVARAYAEAVERAAKERKNTDED